MYIENHIVLDSGIYMYFTIFTSIVYHALPITSPHSLCMSVCTCAQESL